MSSRRLCQLNLLPLAVASLAACSSYQKPRRAVLAPKSQIIVRFDSPRSAILTPNHRSDSSRTCYPRVVQGRLSAIAGDTITLSPLKVVEYFGPRDSKCEGGRALRFERIVNDRMTVRAFSPARTGVLVLVLGVLAGAIASSEGPQVDLGDFCLDGPC